MREEYYLLKKDGETIHRGTKEDHARYLHESHHFSLDESMKDQGFSLVLCGALYKEKGHAENKDRYLLGVTEYDEKLWLEAGSWDCDWYWGFGYVVTNRSFSHFNGLVGFKAEKGNYVHHLNESPRMKQTVLNEAESWALCDLMQSFYTLKAAAEIYHMGNSRLTSTPGLSLKNVQAEKRINKIEIPKIMEAVYQLLSPIKKGE